MTGIEWTEATWNPTTGCAKVSEGCRNCYAETMAKRLHAQGLKKYRNEFRYTEHEDALDIPLRWRKPRMIFVNSMSDLFYGRATPGFLEKVFDVMCEADWHTYQILTKRPHIMAEWSNAHIIPPHIWMGTSIENADNMHRLDELRNVNCHVRFISFEPLLGDVGELDLSGIHWCIIGGESGAHYRPVRKEWILNIIRQCREQNVPVFFKQWGGIRPNSGGRMIDGRIYDEYPKPKIVQEF